MRGRALYFYALKEDMVERIKEVEEKLGGLQYAIDKAYKRAELKIYSSIDEISDIGIVRPVRARYMIALKNDKFNCREIKLLSGGYSYRVEDEKGGVYFEPSGIYEGTDNCIILGEMNTVSTNETRQLIYKELRKSLLKSMMLTRKGDIVYVGKSVIENKEKYRLLYGGVNSNPNYDYQIGNAEWKEKGKKSK